MASRKNFLGLIDAGREIRRSPLVGMQFLHEGAVRAPDVVPSRARLQAKDLVGLLVRHLSARRRASLPPCRVALRVLTPSGKPAVKIAFK